jgi:hypothetical protein
MNCVQPRAPASLTLPRAAVGSEIAPDSPWISFASNAAPEIPYCCAM